MINRFKKYYLEEQFNPKIIGLFTNPFYIARKGLYKNIFRLSRDLNGNILDIGCGSKPYQKLFHNTNYFSLELDSNYTRKHKSADYYYDGVKMPFENSYFDNLITNQVFEHVFNPDEFLCEVNRILKLGGFFIISVPFVWDEHEQPFDYARYSSFGIEHILRKYGFEIIQHEKSNNGIEAISQLLICYFHKVTLTKYAYLNLLIVILLISPINLITLLFSKVMPKNNDLYLDNILLAKKIKNV